MSPRPGAVVAVKHCSGAYRLPDGLAEGEIVRLIRFDFGYWECEKDGRPFKIALPCIDTVASERLSTSHRQAAPAKVPTMAFNRSTMATKAAKLATQGVYAGTSSWKYEGWLGQLYTAGRYEYRGKVATTRFERACLSEYAEVIKTECVDAAYYTFPSEKYLSGLVSQVPADFQFGFKVTNTITIRKFPNLPRFGIRAGKANEDFLNADLFSRAFLKPCESIRGNVGMLMFEFSRFYPSDYPHGRDFVADLDRFLGELPKGWPYAVEVRNKHWLVPEYFG